LPTVALDHPRDLDAGRDAELHEHVANVRLDRLLTEEELLGDLGVRQAVGDQVRDLTLACRE
jgi:hypothetical protein